MPACSATIAKTSIMKFYSPLSQAFFAIKNLSSLLVLFFCVAMAGKKIKVRAAKQIPRQYVQWNPINYRFLNKPCPPFGNALFVKSFGNLDFLAYLRKPAFKSIKKSICLRHYIIGKLIVNLIMLFACDENFILVVPLSFYTLKVIVSQPFYSRRKIF